MPDAICDASSSAATSRTSLTSCRSHLSTAGRDRLQVRRFVRRGHGARDLLEAQPEGREGRIELVRGDRDELVAEGDVRLGRGARGLRSRELEALLLEQQPVAEGEVRHERHRYEAREEDRVKERPLEQRDRDAESHGQERVRKERGARREDRAHGDDDHVGPDSPRRVAAVAIEELVVVDSQHPDAQGEALLGVAAHPFAEEGRAERRVEERDDPQASRERVVRVGEHGVNDEPPRQVDAPPQEQKASVQPDRLPRQRGARCAHPPGHPDDDTRPRDESQRSPRRGQ